MKLAALWARPFPFPFHPHLVFLSPKARPFALTGKTFGFPAKDLAFVEHRFRLSPEDLGVIGKSFRLSADGFGEAPI